jgi:hypothetical protein
MDRRTGGRVLPGPASKLCRPVPEGRFGPSAVNVAQQRRDPDSLLSWMERVIRRQRETPELGWGEVTVLETSERAVLAHSSDWEGASVVAVHNLGGEPCCVDVGLGCSPDTTLVDLLDTGWGPPSGGGDHLDLAAGGVRVRWLRVQEPGGGLVS